MDLRRQRIDNEWTILGQMAEANPDCLDIKERRPDEFLLVLKQSSAPVHNAGKIGLVYEHELRFVFARFFPAVPIEAYLTRAVFHPNIHPTTGFVCLWNRFSKADTVVEALCQLQRILTYSVFSHSPDDVMQPEALSWALNANRGTELPLSCTLLVKPPGWPEERDFRTPPARRRLS
jgi:ubiquitin-protein ligase